MPLESRGGRLTASIGGKKIDMFWLTLLKLGLDMKSFMTADRLRAVRQLARADDPRAIGMLAVALKDRNAVVRQTAAEALGQVGINALVHPLMQALTDVDPTVRKNAVISLRRLVGPNATVLFMPVLTEADPATRALVIDTLGDIGDFRDAESLLASLDDPDDKVRETAARALGKIGDERALDPLLTLLRYDANGEVRATAAEALGRIGDARVINPLLAAIADTEEWVQFRAIAALIGFGETAVEPLIFLLTHSKPSVRVRAASALGKVGHRRAVDPLRAALRDKNAELRKAAAEALGKIGDESAVHSLLQALNDETPAVRWKTAHALAEMGLPQAVRPLIEFAADDTLAEEAFRVLREMLSVDAARISTQELHALTRLDVVLSRLTGAGMHMSIRNENTLIKQLARRELQRREVIHPTPVME